MIYFLFKFIHIAGAIIWIGSVFTLGILTHRVTKKEDHAGAAALAQQSELFGRAVIGPSAMLTLISGIVMVAVYGMGTPFWIIWGFFAALASGILGGQFAQKTGTKLAEEIKSEEINNSRLNSLQRRLAILNSINMLLLFSAVWVMVFKTDF